MSSLWIAVVLGNLVFIVLGTHWYTKRRTMGNFLVAAINFVAVAVRLVDWGMK